jgi:hypothetical protein
VLCLDGLRGAANCPHTFRVPIFDVALFNTIDGTIPRCLWEFQNLTYLHLAGNGLTGTIAPPPAATVLRDVVLSHNQLSGTIPTNIQQIPVLDLSYNSFSGYLDFNSSVNKTDIRLAVNRLSGTLHASGWLSTVRFVDILESNIFKCGSIPDNDEYFQFYSCESQGLDWALYLMASALVVSCCVLCCAYCLTREGCSQMSNSMITRLREVAGKYRNHLYYFRNPTKLSQLDNNVDKTRVATFVQSLSGTTQAIVCLAGLLLASSLPIYILKISEYFDNHQFEYSTYADTYRWFWTYAYISGEVPAVLILIGWVVVISVYYGYGIIFLPSYDSTLCEQKRNRSATMVEIESKYHMNWLVEGGYLLLNVAAHLGLNGTYIYLAHQDYSSVTQLAIQMAMAVIKLLYTLVCIPLLASHIPVSNPNIWFRLILLIINNLIIPCLAVAFESPTCFQGLFFESDEIYSFYSINVCSSYSAFLNQKICTEEVYTIVEIAPLIPPFSYNYQCASAILTSYIPVYMYIYSLQILLPFAYVLLLTWFKYDDFPRAFHPLLHAMMCPKHFSKQAQQASPDEYDTREEEQCVEALTVQAKASVQQSGDDILDDDVVLSDPFLLLDSRDIITTDILNHLIMMLSFGFCSPMLTLAISLSVVLKLNMWVVLLGRFASYFEAPQEPKSRIDVMYQTLSETCLSLTLIYHMSLWPVVWSSALFFAVLCWDLCADEVGWAESLWAPLLVLSVPVLLWLGNAYRDRHWRLLRGAGAGGADSYRRGSGGAEVNMELMDAGVSRQQIIQKQKEESARDTRSSHEEEEEEVGGGMASGVIDTGAMTPAGHGSHEDGVTHNPLVAGASAGAAGAAQSGRPVRGGRDVHTADTSERANEGS